MPTLKELREQLLAKERNEQSQSNDNALYPFWNMNYDQTAVIRFLPDGNMDNSFFWVERQMIKLDFPGVVGQDPDKVVSVQVPCMEMWGDKCPILNDVRPWFKDASKEDLARKYWKKRTYIFQGFVRDNPLKEDDGPENPIRRFSINKSIFEIIKAALMDPEMDDMPIDYKQGRDFRLIKTRQGEYANYKTSSYSLKATSLTDQEMEAVEKYGLSNLEDYLPKKPDQKTLDVIYEMFTASVNGDLYDPAKWAQYYKPYGLQVEESKDDSTVDNKKETVKPKKVSTEKLSSDDVLALVKKRATSTSTN